jgi:hypothetical protein
VTGVVVVVPDRGAVERVGLVADQHT